MGTDYGHLTAEERYRIARLHEDGQSIRKIAAALDRAPSSISRELKRNSGAQVGYTPAYAHEQSLARRWTGSKLARDDRLREMVLGCLARGWSPEAVAGRLRQQKAKKTVSHETIYKFIYDQFRRTQDCSWQHYLPKAKFKRGWRRRRGGSPESFIKDRVSIAERPKTAGNRQNSGHWEADHMGFSNRAQAILVMHDRKSRLTLFKVQPNKTAVVTADQLLAWMRQLPLAMRKTITFDNGSEFVQHYKLKQKLGIKTYFCNTHSPWQKGGIENAIGRMRRFLPTKTNLNDINQQTLNAYAATCNNTPRKCLGYKTPAEVFHSQVLHFKLESTCQLSLA
jgi:IS30 family transposase